MDGYWHADAASVHRKLGETCFSFLFLLCNGSNLKCMKYKYLKIIRTWGKVILLILKNIQKSRSTQKSCWIAITWVNVISYLPPLVCVLTRQDSLWWRLEVVYRTLQQTVVLILEMAAMRVLQNKGSNERRIYWESDEWWKTMRKMWW